MSSTGRARLGRLRSGNWEASLPTANSRRWARRCAVTNWSRTSCCGDRTTADLHRVLGAATVRPRACNSLICALTQEWRCLDLGVWCSSVRFRRYCAGVDWLTDRMSVPGVARMLVRFVPASVDCAGPSVTSAVSAWM